MLIIYNLLWPNVRLATLVSINQGGSTVLVGVVKRYYSTAVKEGIGVTMVTTTMGPVLAVQGELIRLVCCM